MDGFVCLLYIQFRNSYLSGSAGAEWKLEEQKYLETEVVKEYAIQQAHSEWNIKQITASGLQWNQLLRAAKSQVVCMFHFSLCAELSSIEELLLLKESLLIVQKML